MDSTEHFSPYEQQQYEEQQGYFQYEYQPQLDPINLGNVQLIDNLSAPMLAFNLWPACDDPNQYYSSQSQPQSYPSPSLASPFEQSVGIPSYGSPEVFDDHLYATPQIPELLSYPTRTPLNLNTNVASPYATSPAPSFNISPSSAHSSGGSWGQSQPPTPMSGWPQTPYMANSPISPIPPSPGAAAQVPVVKSQQQPQQLISTVWDIAAGFPSRGRGPVVPQKFYRPHTVADRKRYVEEVDLEEPIMFIMCSPDECGIPLRDALSGKYMRLMGRDDPMFIQRGPSVSIRLKWPGYGSWSRQIPTKDFRTPPGPITRAKLAKNIARTVERFIKEKQGHVIQSDEDVPWKVGPGCITIDDLVLVGLQHVSKGSWQAHLRLARPRPITTNVNNTATVTTNL